MYSNVNCSVSIHVNVLATFGENIPDANLYRRGKGEKAGWKNWSEVQIAAADRAVIGGVVLRPYVPHSTKWIGEITRILTNTQKN